MINKKVAALSVSIAAVGMAAVLFNSAPSNVAPVVHIAPKPDTDEVLVAALDIPMGTRIGDESVKWQIWPKASISEEMIVKSSGPNVLADIKDSLTRVPFLHGEPMRRDKVVKLGAGGFMSAILPAGMRAVAIKIDSAGDTEAGGFILPNDRVDVLRIYRDDEATRARGTEVLAAQTILANVQVLAIGQTIQEDNHKKVVTGGNATLELDPSQAEQVVLAEHIGGSSLHLILRSLADSGGPADTVSELESGKNGGVTIVRFGAAQRAAR